MWELLSFVELVSVSYQTVAVCREGGRACYGITAYNGRKLAGREKKVHLVLPYAKLSLYRSSSAVLFFHNRVNALELRGSFRALGPIWLGGALSYYPNLNHSNFAPTLSLKAGNFYFGVDFRGITLANRHYYEPPKLLVQVRW